MNIDKALSITGWMSHGELMWLAETAESRGVIVEFGSYMGRSTRALGDHCPGVVYAVDPWNGIYIGDNGERINILKKNAEEIFHSNLSDLIMKRKVIPFKGFSSDFLPPMMVDFVFLDGDHRKAEVLKDIEIAKSFLRSGGIIAGHDYTHKDWPGVKEAVDLSFKNINQVDSIWWTHV